MRACLVCGTPSNGSRCPRHARAGYTNRERLRRAEVVTLHVALNGWTCPGWGVEPHPSRDLTADHVEAVAAGGAEDGPLRVLCRACNARKGAD